MNPSDLSTDPIRREAHAWVRHLASGKATVADAEALKRWCATSARHAAAFAEAQRLWQDFGTAGRQLMLRSAASANGGNVPLRQRRMSRRAFLGGALAATAAGAVVAVAHPPFGWWPSAEAWNADYRTAAGEQQRVQLGDGVSIELNTRTSVSLQASDGAGFRLIEGETAIDSPVRLARPFSVFAERGRVWTDGNARFEVRHDGDRVCATCLAGAIGVERDGRTLTLRAAERVFYGADGMDAPFRIDPASVSAWREGVVIFRRTPLSEAVAEINRYRPGRVVLLDDKLGENVVSGRFGIRDMDQAIAQIRVAFGARVTRLPGNVVLLG